MARRGKPTAISRVLDSAHRRGAPRGSSGTCLRFVPNSRLLRSQGCQTAGRERPARKSAVVEPSAKLLIEFSAASASCSNSRLLKRHLLCHRCSLLLL